uniref:Uncharacterized protein n=1 Tax=uncultured Desulfobacterium sp. TaxID=201089 RepID=E1YMT7_9BACT|nr:unknown protein [uncultured Desulfobacterium sp.]
MGTSGRNLKSLPINLPHTHLKGSDRYSFNKLANNKRRSLNNLPVMIYHGVNTEHAVLMRINSVQRSVGTNLGNGKLLKGC